jgi:hypothetical protein
MTLPKTFLTNAKVTQDLEALPVLATYIIIYDLNANCASLISTPNVDMDFQKGSAPPSYVSTSAAAPIRAPGLTVAEQFLLCKGLAECLPGAVLLC